MRAEGGWQRDIERIVRTGTWGCLLVLLSIGAAAGADEVADDGAVREDPAETTLAPPPGETDAPANGAEAVAKPDRPRWTDLPETLVTATRGEAKQFSTPYMTYVMNPRGFSTNRQPRTTTKLMEEIPGVMVQKTAHGQGSPYIRGFTGFRTLMMQDGIRLNNSFFRDGPNEYWNMIDPFSIDRLEVVKGPAGALYGSDAIGGAVNAISFGPEGYGDGWNVWRQYDLQVATATRAVQQRGTVNATYGDRLGIRVAGGWHHYGEVDGGGGVGPQSHTNYDYCGGDFRLDYRPDADTRWTFAHYQTYQDDAWRTHKTTHGISWEDTTVGSERMRSIDTGRSLSYVRYDRRNLGSLIDAVQLTFSFQQLYEQQWRVRGDGRSDRKGADADTYGFAAQFESPSPFGRWTYGLEWYHDEVDSFSRQYSAGGALTSEGIQGSVADDASYDLLGIYVQDQIELGERVEVILGGRYTYAEADADSVEDPDTGARIGIREDWEALVGSARVSWFVDEQEHWNLFGGVSQGFRAPNLSDLTRLDTARTNEIETPSPGLDPERFLSYEAGVKGQYDDLFLQASWHYTDITDMIVRTPTGNIVAGDNEVTKKNAGDGYVNGVELAGRYRFHEQWTAFGAFYWIYGRVDTFPSSAPVEESEPISRLAPPMGQVGVRWDHPDRPLWIETAARFACKADRLSTRDKADTQRIPPGGTPGWLVFDVRGGCELTEGLDVWAGLENFTNVDYRIHGSGVNEPGINFKFGMSWRF